MNLFELQQSMGDFLVAAPECTFAETMRHAPGLGVYRNNYRGSLLACLRDTYEKCCAWLGDDAFDSAARAHIDTHAPVSWTLDAYGHDFDETLRGLYPDDPEVAEMAWLEWAMRRAFDGPDATPVDLTELGNINWEQARFQLVPTLKLCTITTNAPAIWSALDNEEPPPEAQLLHVTTILCVWRYALSPCFRSIEGNEARLLDMAQNGISFGAICGQLTTEIGEEEAAKVSGAALGQWLNDGLIVGITSSE